MSIARTTGCCRALALVALAGGFLGAHETPAFSIFPSQPLWTVVLGAALAAPPAFDGDRAYFALDDNRLVAYELARGTERWTSAISTVAQPAAGDGLVFLADRQTLTAISDRDGTLAWQQELAEPLAAPLVWDNGWLVAAGQNGTIAAYRAADGTAVWRHRLEAPVGAAPSLAADRVYLPLQDDRVVALQIERGEPVWERRLGGRPSEILALDDRVYVGSDDNFFYALRAHTGQIDWRWRTGADVVGPAAADDRRVYFVSLDNMLRAVNRTSGVQHWKRQLPLRSGRGPLIAGTSLLVSGVGQVLPGFSLQNGQPAGDLEVAGDVVAAPHAFEIFGVPAVVIVTHDFAEGTVVRCVGRRIEPALAPVAPLPDPVVPSATTPS